MAGGVKSEKKTNYLERVKKLLDEYNQMFFVECDNVGANHLQKIRKLIRPMGAVILMGKNTMIRKAIRDHVEANPKIENILPHIKGPVGLVLCKGKMKEVLGVLESERVAAPAKAGAFSPVDVIVPPGVTKLEPTQTAFLQALNIQTKVTKGNIEILREVHLLKPGQRVGNSEAILLSKLAIKPFTYGLSVKNVYDDGAIYSADVCKITDEIILGKFFDGVARVASISLAVGYPTLASLPHSIINGYKRVVAVALAADIAFPRIEALKKLLDDPNALAAAAAASAAPAAGGAKAADKPKEAEKPKEEEKEEAPMSFDLFD